MLSLRSIATAVVAILLGLIAIVLVNNYLKAGEGKGAPAPESPGSPVVVAGAQIGRGVALSPALLKIVKYPADAVPAGAFHAISDISAPGAPPRTTVRAIGANEPILPTDISGLGARQTLSTTITPGLEAIAIRANDVTGVGGFALPGDRVDVLLTRTVQVGLVAQATWLTEVLAEDVKVLGVDQISDQASQNPVVARAVTLEVTHAQAQAIALGQAAGSLSLSLRRDGDHSLVAKRVTTVADLAGAPAPHVARPRAAPVKSEAVVIHITRGTMTTDYSMGGH